MFQVKMGEELNPGTWFPFQEGKTVEEAGGICLRVLNRRKLREIEKQVTTRMAEVVVPKGAPVGTPGQRVEWSEVDSDLEDELTWDYCIVDWKGLVDENDVLIPCTKENKVRLMQDSLHFLRFVRVKQAELNKQLAEELKAKEKNL